MTREEMLFWLDKGAPTLCLSAQKWRDIRDELIERSELNVPLETFHAEEYKGSTCALCETTHQSTCNGCKICKFTGIGQCYETPYKYFQRAHRNNDMPAMIAAAETEIAMLEYLEEVYHPYLRNRNVKREDSDMQLHSSSTQREDDQHETATALAKIASIIEQSTLDGNTRTMRLYGTNTVHF